MTFPQIILTKKHYVRLRKYWHAGRSGLASNGDAIVVDLTAAGHLEMVPSGARLHMMITASGIACLQAEIGREKERRKPHHDFGSRLSSWLQEQRRITWENIEFIVEDGNGGRNAVRPDVFSLAASLEAARINPTVYEVKVSRADFLADLARPEKRAGYALLCEAFYYAAPAGLIDPAELPQDCGLVEEVSEGVFSVVSKPKKRRATLTTHHFMNLILKPGSICPLE